MQDEKIMFVSATTLAKNLGSAIAHDVYEGKPVKLRAIGAGSISQAAKAIIIARGFAAPRGFDLLVRMGFSDVDMPDRTVTAVTFEIVVG